MDFPAELKYNLTHPIEYAQQHSGLIRDTSRGLFGAMAAPSKPQRTQTTLDAVQKYFPNNPNAQSAIMGNIKGENHRFDFQEIEGEDVDEQGYGLFQFTGEQRDAYFRYLNATGLSDSPDSQVNYFRHLIYSNNPTHEIGSVNQDRIREQINTGSVKDISDVIAHRYENPKNLSGAQATRGRYSEEFSEQLGLPSPNKTRQTPRKPFGAMSRNR